VNVGAGTIHQAQSTPPKQTKTGGSVEASMTQQAQSAPSGQTSTGVNLGAVTTQQAPNTPPSGEKPTEDKVEEKDEYEQDGMSQAKHVGTCQMFSCAKGKMFYQLLRIEELREDGDFDMSFPADSQIVLTMGGPVCKETP
jgi:hypothetical protein